MSSLKAEALGNMLQGGRVRLDALSDEARAELRDLAGQAALQRLEAAGPNAARRLAPEYHRAIATNAGPDVLRNFKRHGVSALDERTRLWLGVALGNDRMYELRRLAGRDGVITSDHVEQLFRWLDGFDADGRRGSIALTQGRPPVAAEGGQPAPAAPLSPAGRALRRVVEGLERDQVFTRDNFVAGYLEGRFDLARLAQLTPAERQALEESGALGMLRERLREGSGQLSTAQLRALFRRVDRLDDDGSGESIRTRTGGPAQVDEVLTPGHHIAERITRSGEAVSGLNKLFVSHRAPDAEAPPVHRADIRPAPEPAPEPAPQLPQAPAPRPPVAPPQPGPVGQHRVDRDTFAEVMRDARIDIGALAQDAAAVQRLTELGLPAARLQQIARGDRNDVIGGPNAEMSRLFAELQRLENPRRPPARLTLDDGQGGRSRTGEVLEVLDRFTTRHRVTTRDELRDALASGHLDLRKLDQVPPHSASSDTRTVAQRLVALGGTPQEREQIERILRSLRKLGEGSPELNGDRVAHRLYELLRPINGHPLRPGTLTLETTHAGERRQTRAGQAYELIASAMATFGHGQRVYRNADEALREAATPVALPIRRVSQASLPRPDEACFRAVQSMLSQVSREARLLQDGQGHWVARSQRRGSNAISATVEDLQASRRYVDWALDNGLPTMVGVSRIGGTDVNRDGITDHYVLITGRDVDAQGRVRYAYVDPGKSTAHYFYVDPNTSMLYVPIGHGVGEGGYQLTHVRPFARVPASTGMQRGNIAEHFEAVTGQRMRGL